MTSTLTRYHDLSQRAQYLYNPRKMVKTLDNNSNSWRTNFNKENVTRGESNRNTNKLSNPWSTSLQDVRNSKPQPSGLVKIKIEGINIKTLPGSNQEAVSKTNVTELRHDKIIQKKALHTIEFEKATAKIDVQSKRKKFEDNSINRRSHLEENKPNLSKNLQIEAHKEVTASKAFEDRASSILNEMRRQRRSMKLENVSTASVPVTKKISSWRDSLNMENLTNETKEDSQTSSQKPSYLSQKRNSISEFVGKVIRKLSIGKQDDSTDREVFVPLHPSQFNNPLDFILMKEEFIKRNPQLPKIEVKICDGTETSMASVMDSLKKIVKKINPKREFHNDIVKREQEEKRKREEATHKSNAKEDKKVMSLWEARMMKYQGATLTPFNSHASRWNSQASLGQRADHNIVDNRAVRERIQNRILSSVHQPFQNKVGDIFHNCEFLESLPYIVHSLSPVVYNSARITTLNEETFVLECTEFIKRREEKLNDIIAHFNKDKEKLKKKICHAKPVIHGLNDSKSDRYSFALVTRSKALWETVKPINVAVRKKTELFAPMSRGRATIIIEGLLVATIISPGTSGSTAYCEQHKWDHLKGCALFGNVGPPTELFLHAEVESAFVINLPKQVILESSEEIQEQVFFKCERTPQSQLVKVIF